MLGKRIDLRTEEAERAAEPVRRQLRFERDVWAQIERFREQLQETRQTLRLSPENVQKVVEVALELAHQPPLQETELAGVWPDPVGQRRSCPVFRLPPLRDTWALCLEGIAHPHTGEIRPITFDHDIGRSRDDVVLVHLNHRLVQMSLRLLRAEICARESAKRLNRAAVFLVPNHVLDTPAVIAHARLVIVGGDSQRLHEEIITAGGEIREGRFRRMNVGQITDALDARMPREPSPGMKERLISIWPNIKSSIIQSLEVRMQARSDSLDRVLTDRMEKEVSDLKQIMEELARMIREKLDEPEPAQLEFEFSRQEKDQYRSDRIALQHRLEQIPGEIEQETALVLKRFVDFQARMFPVAVTFLVPERLAH